MKTCLITGASGLIGSHLIHNLIKDWEVIAVVRPHSKPKDLSSVHWIEADLSTSHFTDIIPKKVDAIIHLAQSNHFRDFPTKAEDIFQVNLCSTLKLLDFGRSTNTKMFIFASTGGVYGFGENPFVAKTPFLIPKDLGFYPSTKLSAELLVQSYSSFFKVVLLRPFFIYGKGQKKEMFLPRLVNNIRNDIPIKLQGTNGIRINPIHVNDAVSMICECLNLQQSETLNIGGKNIYSLRQIGDIIGKKLSKTPKYEIQQDDNPKHLIGDIQKTIDILKLEPKIPLEKGIDDLL